MEETNRHAPVIALMREILGESYTHLLVERLRIEDDLGLGNTTVTCDVSDESSVHRSTLSGKGVGLVDAFFCGMINRFAGEYPSLKTIRFTRFTVDAQLDTKEGYAGTDSNAVVTIEVANSDDTLFTFSDASRSMIAASVRTCLAALVYFINSERAFVMTYHALKDAQKRQRADLVQRYTNNMATLVKNTSYSEVIAKLRSDSGID